DVPLGTPCPDFRLRSVDGRIFARDDFRTAPVLVVMFICNHCPYVQAVEDRIIALAREYGPRGVAFVGICSNDPTDYPDDSPPNLLRRWREKAYGFPYLVDESQEVARAFDAVCTPDIYVFDRERRLAYHGRIDDNWREPARVTRRELAAALDALLAGRPAPAEQHHTMGCSIKWRKTGGR
ncbi:MAG TPA: thioredoxin family protein, partial [Candidatus Binatia bacterium]|nr:thioredoxin family protein [Candidatus Binatia bacterium]